MSVFFTSDLHFGHKNIHKHRDVESEEDNTSRICSDWNARINAKDIVYVLGDAVFTEARLATLGNLPGTKILVKGNHDELTTYQYMSVFKDVFGLVKYKEFWLSHAPIHPQELRGKINLHGHVHHNSIPDSRYFNCCIENLWAQFGTSLVELQQLRKHLKI